MTHHLNKSIVLSLLILCASVFCYGENDFVVNTKKPVSLESIKSIYDFWTVIRIDYPDSKAVFVYTENSIEFGLFDLKKDGKFLVFMNPIAAEKFSIKINGKIPAGQLSGCFVQVGAILEKNLEGNIESDKKPVLHPFGCVVDLQEKDSCEISFESIYQSAFRTSVYQIKVDRINNGNGFMGWVSEAKIAEL